MVPPLLWSGCSSQPVPRYLYLRAWQAFRKNSISLANARFLTICPDQDDIRAYPVIKFFRTVRDR